MSAINEERLEKFKKMGLPMPMAPIDPVTVQGPVRNQDFAAKLAAIKSGGKKQEINTFIEKSSPQAGFVPLEVPVPKNKKLNEGSKDDKKNTPALHEFKAQPIPGVGVDLEKALYGESIPGTSNFKTASELASRSYQSDIDDENGTNFFDTIKQRLSERASKGQSIQRNEGSQVLTESRKSGINEDDLKDYITEVSTDICKKLIKKFMSEYLASEPGLIKENDKIKKAEIVREDIVKIDGRFFKLTPVQVKKK
jgi:hypothetical protein